MPDIANRFTLGHLRALRFELGNMYAVFGLLIQNARQTWFPDYL
jgi:hypothetical protein